MMLKGLALFLSLTLTVLMLTGPALALGDKSSKGDNISHVKGDVLSVDQNAKTLTVKKGGLRHKELTFQVDDPALLANVQTGQTVRVGYVKDGAQMIAKEVAPGTTASRKR